MDIKLYKLLLIFIIITSFYPLIVAYVAVTKTVYFHDCDAYRHYLKPGDIYKVVWNGEVYPRMCNIRFEMSGIDTYKLCAKVTVFDLECERRGDGRRLLQFYWGTAMKQKAYGCHARLPIRYCNEGTLSMKLKPEWNDIRASNSRIRITVTSTLKSSNGDSSTTGGSISGFFGLVVVVGIIIFCVLFLKKRAAARNLERNAGAVIIHRQGNNVCVATFNTGQPAQSNQQNPGEQQVPLVEYGTAGRIQPGGLDQFRYPPVSVGPTSHPDYHREVYATAPPVHATAPPVHPTAPPLSYYEEHTQLPSHVEGSSSQLPEYEEMTVPPPSYEDVMQNEKAY